jgi:hypothetical protein
MRATTVEVVRAREEAAVASTQGREPLYQGETAGSLLEAGGFVKEGIEGLVGFDCDRGRRWNRCGAAFDVEAWQQAIEPTRNPPVPVAKQLHR